MKPQILIIVGSLRKDSFNKVLANKVVELFNLKADFELLDYKDIPYMNQDLESDVPTSIKDIRDKVLKADGLFIFTPEYNHMIPGVLKNLLDWLSRPVIPNDRTSAVIRSKKVAIAGVAGNSGAKYALEDLRKLLKQINAEVLDIETSCVIPASTWATGIYELSQDNINDLINQTNAFLNFIK